MELIPIIKTVFLIISAISLVAVVLSYIGYKIRNGSEKKPVETHQTVNTAPTMSAKPVIFHNLKPANSQVITNKVPVKKYPPKKIAQKKPDEPKNAERYKVVNGEQGFPGEKKNPKDNYIFKNPYTNQNFQSNE